MKAQTAIVAKIATGVTSKNGNTINLVTLQGAPIVNGRTDANGNPLRAAIILTDHQFTGMCLKAGIIPSQAGNLLVGAEISGEFEYQLAGAQYIANEYSRDVIAGHVKVGASLEREEDGYRVDSILEFTLDTTVAATLNASGLAVAQQAHKLAQLRRAALRAPFVAPTPETPVNTGAKPISRKATK
jgi:hypothetical protein